MYKELSPINLAPIFSLLANEKRIQLIEILKAKAFDCRNPATCDLSERCCNVGELAEELGIAVSTASYHIRELRLGGLIQTRRRGKWVYCSINRDIIAHLAHFFESLIRETQTETWENRARMGI